MTTAQIEQARVAAAELKMPTAVAGGEAARIRWALSFHRVK
jgi:hypothetical protein